jgi:AraC-like DNA-binding protein
MPAAREGFLLGVSLEGGHTRTIFETGKTAKHEFAVDTIYARNLEDDYKADLQGTFNFVLIELSPSSLKNLADGADLKGISELKRVQASPDPVLAALARAIFSTRAEGREPSALFLDQIALALGSHIVHTYGNGNLGGSPRRRTLSRKNEVRAKELMRSRLDGNLSVAELASECNLSQGVFIKAFRETTGKTPHQWLTQQRIERAQHYLLETDYSLAEISAECGFADQSHLSKVFSTIVGTTPSAWRKDRKQHPWT